MKHHRSIDLTRQISNINWHREKERIVNVYESIISQHRNNLPDFSVHKQFNGYISANKEIYGFETIGISQSDKFTGVIDVTNEDQSVSYNCHKEYGINFIIVHSVFGLTQFFINRKKCDDSTIEHPEILLFYTKNTAYISKRKLESLFKSVLFYEMMTSFHREKTWFSALKFGILKFRSELYRKGVKNTLSVGLIDSSMLLIALLSLLCAYLAIPST